MSEPGEMAERGEQRKELLEAIAHLPRERQHLLLLKFSQEMPNAKIALAMGRSEGAVKALLHRTLVSLKRIIVTPQSEERKKHIPNSELASGWIDTHGNARNTGDG
jgi:DNA-directed RNA polymerase specialized sigma24 family protein